MTHALLEPISQFLKMKHLCAERMSAAHFGRCAARDGRLVERLKAGGDVRSRKADVIRQYIHEETHRLTTEYPEQRQVLRELSQTAEPASSCNSQEITQ